MTEPTDTTFYLGPDALGSYDTLDVPVSNGEIVSINLKDDLPEDANEIISFLEHENCPRKYWIAIASAYYNEERLDDSFNVVKRAIDSNSFSAEDISQFHIYTSWLYLKLASNGTNKEENLENAAKELKFATNKDDIVFLSALAVIYLFKDHFEQALDIFEKLLERNHNNCFALMGKAQIILKKTKNYKNALKLYQQVLMLNPVMKPDPRIGIGLCFWSLNDRNMAITSFERALELDADNSKAKILFTLAKFDEAFNHSLSDEEFISNYKKCLEETAKLHVKCSRDPATSLVLASFFFSKEDFESVEKIINKISEDITGSSSLIKFSKFSSLSKFQSSILSQCSLWLGRISFENSDYTQSQKYFHEAIKFDDSNLLAKLGLGQSQAVRGSTEEAIITYESILKTNPKSLEVNYSLGILYSKHKSKRKQEQAITILEKYLKLSNNRGFQSGRNSEKVQTLNKEPVILNAYLVLSRLYESRDINQSLTFLRKAIESQEVMGQTIPIEIYNNIGVFNYMKNNNKEAVTFFRKALEEVAKKNVFKSETGESLEYLKDDMSVTFSYNLARANETLNEAESVDAYEKLLEKSPNYFSAKLRLLFLDSVSYNKLSKEEIQSEIEQLLELSSSNTEIRSFYGWFVKTFGKKLGINPDADVVHQKQTLVDYDSHDCYALISFANIYGMMGRDTKGSGADAKKKKYYIRAIELYTKVLSIDPKNVFAAQGLAIVYIENKRIITGSDILRKIRDSLDDISIYLNLGHALVDLKQYSKAVENYEIALTGYTDGKDSRVLSFLGRAWYHRGVAEKNINFLKKSLELSEEAYHNFTGSKSSLRFNIAYVQFQIAEQLTKLPLEQRTVEDIQDALVSLNSAIDTLNDLASEEEPHAPYPKAELKARASLGTNTLINRLNTALQETKDHTSMLESRIEEAKKLREEEILRRTREEEERLQAKKLKEEELAKERSKLQEQAQQWAEEARMDVIDDDLDDKLFNEESEKRPEKKKKAVKSDRSNGKGKKGKRGKKKAVVDSDESSTAESEVEMDSSLNNDQSDIKGTSGEKRQREENEDDAKTSNKKNKYLSNERIDDSDEDLDDDLFGNESETKEQE